MVLLGGFEALEGALKSVLGVFWAGMNNHRISLTILHLTFDQWIQTGGFAVNMIIVFNEPLASFTIIGTEYNNTSWFINYLPHD
jgi:hypothetical protein